jgi:hypothetical protein
MIIETNEEAVQLADGSLRLLGGYMTGMEKLGDKTMITMFSKRAVSIREDLLRSVWALQNPAEYFDTEDPEEFERMQEAERVTVSENMERVMEFRDDYGTMMSAGF